MGREREKETETEREPEVVAHFELEILAKPKRLLLRYLADHISRERAHFVLGDVGTPLWSIVSLQKVSTFNAL